MLVFFRRGESSLELVPGTGRQKR